MTLNGVINPLFCVFSQNSIALLAMFCRKMIIMYQGVPLLTCAFLCCNFVTVISILTFFGTFIFIYNEIVHEVQRNGREEKLRIS